MQPWPSSSARTTPTQLSLHLCVWTFCSAFSVVGILLACQRLFGQLNIPATPAQQMVAAVAIALLAWLGSRSLRVNNAVFATNQGVWQILFTVGTLGVAIGLSVGVAAFAGFTLWMATLVAIYWTWEDRLRLLIAIESVSKSLTTEPTISSDKQNTETEEIDERGGEFENATFESTAMESRLLGSTTEVDTAEEELVEEELDDEWEPLAPEIQQQVTRTVEGGVDTLAFTQRVTLEPGERTTNVHISVCPPFQSAPTTVEAYLLDDVDMDVKVADQQTYGIRLECRVRTPSDEPTEIAVQCIARADA